MFIFDAAEEIATLAKDPVAWRKIYVLEENL